MDRRSRCGTPYPILQLLLLLLLLLVQGSSSIRITQVRVPTQLEVGKAGTLSCTVETEGDELYSIKWYQDAHEFYRYTPTARDPIQIFDPPTLDVDRERSWAGSVSITNVTLAADGPFHCEVSADAPTFHTASDTAYMKVVDLPDSGPSVTGVKSHYQPGDWVDLTCVSRRSYPAPDLSFLVNSEPAAVSWMDRQNNSLDGGLYTASLRLRFSLLPRLLHEGDATVTCVAEIHDIYRDTAYEVLSTTPRYQASVLEGGAAAGTPPGPWHSGLLTLLLMLVSHAAHAML